MENTRIVKDDVMSGSPRIAGTRIRVRDIVEKYIGTKESPPVIAKEFRITVSDVHAALSYYYEHQSEIKQEVSKDRLFIEKFKENLTLHKPLSN